MRDQGDAGHNRRSILQALAAGAGWFATGRGERGMAFADTVPTPVGGDPAALQPGQFLWHPDRAPQGPVVIIASIPRQLVHVYRNGLLAGVSTCSTGKPGHSTPVGRFTVINKLKDHRSSKYGDPMPNTLRLTRKGVALHGGDVPGYPMSHGCVHLPLMFADALFELTALGTPVTIGGLAQHLLVHGPGIVPAGSVGKVIAARDAARSLVPAGTEADTAILVSAADRRIYVLQDGTIVAQGPAVIKDAEEPLGTNVFVWRGGAPAGNGSIWQRNVFQPVRGGSAVADGTPLERIDGGRIVMAAAEQLMHSGTVLLTTDAPLSRVRPPQPRRRREASRGRRRRASR